MYIVIRGNIILTDLSLFVTCDRWMIIRKRQNQPDNTRIAQEMLKMFIFKTLPICLKYINTYIHGCVVIFGMHFDPWYNIFPLECNQYEWHFFRSHRNWRIRNKEKFLKHYFVVFDLFWKSNIVKLRAKHET